MTVAELSIRADAEEVRRASAWLEKTGLDRAVPAEEIGRLDLCLNETLANILAHGGPAARLSPVNLYLELNDSPGNKMAALTVTDCGIPFDPLAYQPRPRPQTLAEAEPGGLGLLMMQNFAESIRYCYSQGRNQLTFSVSWDAAG